jgi:hypothetical protein
MKASFESTLWATLIATAVGFGVWWFGAARLIWPAHPQLAAFIVTLVVTVVVQRLWLVELSKSDRNPRQTSTPNK